MRRLFVICLILLFPLNVLALSTSVASLQAGATHHVASQPASADAAAAADAADARLAKAFDCKLTCDVDPDEPPSGTDFHDTVNEAVEPALALAPVRILAPFTPTRHILSPFPPIKPPPVA